MASTTSDNAFATPARAPTDVVWQTMLPSIEKNNYELLLPLQAEQLFGEQGLSNLKERLSQYLSDNGELVQVIGFRDNAMGRYRIMRTPTFGSEGGVSSTSIEKSYAKTKKLRTAAKKAKVPRPPNAFILFRAFRHPQLKAELPELHNNDISIILGKEWKDASEAVKNHFRAQAEAQKAKHAAENPGYQYAPRKPSEKKRRMTAKKAARLAEQQASQNLIQQRTEPAYSVAMDHTLDFSSSLPTPESSVNQLDDGSLEFTLPDDAYGELQFEIEEHNASILDADLNHSSFLPLQQDKSARSTIPALVQNDQSFFDSCVDWRKIADDLEYLQENPSYARVSGDAFGRLMIGTPDDRALFEQELADLGSLL